MLDKNSISKAIDNLRLPMAIMVVAIHCYFFNSLNINALPSKWGGVFVEWIINICSIVLTGLCGAHVFCYKRLSVFLASG